MREREREQGRQEDAEGQEGERGRSQYGSGPRGPNIYRAVMYGCLCTE